jgi:hypothetical protein
MMIAGDVGESRNHSVSELISSQFARRCHLSAVFLEQSPTIEQQWRSGLLHYFLKAGSKIFEDYRHRVAARNTRD